MKEINRYREPEFKWFEGSIEERLIQFLFYVISALVVGWIFQAIGALSLFRG